MHSNIKPQLEPQLWSNWGQVGVKLWYELRVKLEVFETPYLPEWTSFKLHLKFPSLVNFKLNSLSTYALIASSLYYCMLE